MRVLETELLAVAADAAPDVSKWLHRTDPDHRREAARRIAAAFQLLSEHGLVEAAELKIDEGGRYDSVIFGRAGGSKVYAFSFSGLASDLAVPLFSAAVALSTNTFGPGSAGDAANTILGVWRNFSALSEPADADAIATLRAIIALRARLSSFSSVHHPSTGELAQELSLPVSRVVPALRTLREKRIADVEHWAGQRGDEADVGNRWSLRL